MTFKLARSDTQTLARLAEIARELGETSLATDIRQLATRVDEGRFFVACVGQFKRGKSTLLNALIGEPVLPVGVTPVTAVPTVLRYGDVRGARVLTHDQWQTIKLRDLSHYVSEKLNPENAKQVDGVEVFLPSPLLASGMCLVDTPGIGSVFSGNTETTRHFIPQIDAAILVIGADPPLSGEELALVQAITANVAETLIVLNKIDRVSQAERQEASAFAARVLSERSKQPIGRIYEVSAVNRLTEVPAADDWDQLVSEIDRRAVQAGRAMTSAAAVRGVARFSRVLQYSITECMRALREPIAASEERIAKLQKTVNDAEQSLRDLGALFFAEQARLSNAVLARRKEFLRRVLPIAAQELARECCEVTVPYGPARRRTMMAKAQIIARRHVMPWLDMEQTHIEELYAAVTQRFVNQVNLLLRQAAQRQPDQFPCLSHELDAQQGFRIRSRFYFQDMISIAQPASPLVYASDVLLGAIHINYFFRKAANDFLEQLLDTNAARVQGDLEQRVVESRRLLEEQVRQLLRDVSKTAEQALVRARALMETGSVAIQSELARLQAFRDEIEPD
jgi:GTP-binding protein EngB required for normal cell division